MSVAASRSRVSLLDHVERIAAGAWVILRRKGSHEAENKTGTFRENQIMSIPFFAVRGGRHARKCPSFQRFSTGIGLHRGAQAPARLWRRRADRSRLQRRLPANLGLQPGGFRRRKSVAEGPGLARSDDLEACL